MCQSQNLPRSLSVMNWCDGLMQLGGHAKTSACPALREHALRPPLLRAEPVTSTEETGQFHPAAEFLETLRTRDFLLTLLPSRISPSRCSLCAHASFAFLPISVANAPCEIGPLCLLAELEGFRTTENSSGSGRKFALCDRCLHNDTRFLVQKPRCSGAGLKFHYLLFVVFLFSLG